MPKSKYRNVHTADAVRAKERVKENLGNYLKRLPAHKFAQMKRQNSAVQKQAAATARLPKYGWALMAAVDSAYRVASKARSQAKPKRKPSKHVRM